MGKIAKALHNVSTLTEFSINNNNFGEGAANAIALVLFHNTKLQKLYLGSNRIQTAGMIKIAKALQNNNNTDREAADDIAIFLSHNTKLTELYLNNNNLQTASVIRIAVALINTVTLVKCKISGNNTEDETVRDILSRNTNLNLFV